jgi:hypothetical protein
MNVMDPHPLWLHLRARHLPRVALALPVLAVLSGWAASWLAAQPDQGAAARSPVTTAAPLVVAILLAVTLAGADVDLDRSQPRLTARLRAFHALAAVAVGSSLLALAVTEQPRVFGAHAMARNTLGLFGIVLLASARLSFQLTWVPVFTYTAVAYSASHGTSNGGVWWAWLMQPGKVDPSWIVAVALLVAGSLVYARRGPVETDGRLG